MCAKLAIAEKNKYDHCAKFLSYPITHLDVLIFKLIYCQGSDSALADICMWVVFTMYMYILSLSNGRCLDCIMYKSQNVLNAQCINVNMS